MTARSWRLAGVLVAVALHVVARPAGGEAPEAGAALLLGGPGVLTDRLAAQLDRWRARHPEVVGPRAARRRLGSEPAAIRSVQTAGVAIQQAEDAVLRMRRDVALDAARRARAALEAVDGRHFAPSVLARAHLAEGAALLLHPAEPDRALEAFRTAFSVDPDHRPDPDRVPTRMAELLLRARASAPPPAPPTRQELASLCARLGVASLVWITARPRDGQVAANLWRYDPRGEPPLRSSRAVWPRQTAPHRLAAALDALLGDPRGPAGRMRRPDGAEAAPVSGGTGPAADDRGSSPAVDSAGAAASPGGPQGVSRARPWFKRWWVWALAGAVVAGSAVAIAAAAGSSTERSYAFRFDL